jgi:hypothetical protein
MTLKTSVFRRPTPRRGPSIDTTSSSQVNRVRAVTAAVARSAAAAEQATRSTVRQYQPRQIYIYMYIYISKATRAALPLATSNCRIHMYQQYTAANEY